MKYKFLLFDSNAVFTYVNRMTLQSIEYPQGQHFIEHIRGHYKTESFEDTIINYCDTGIIFCGKSPDSSNVSKKVFCFDLTACGDIMSESDSNLLFIFQKAFRTALKIWNRHPFSSSERVHGTKSILFPFPYPDPRRLVIERSSTVLQLESQNIDFPLLAYKYNSEDPSQDEDTVDTTILKFAEKSFNSKFCEICSQLKELDSASPVDVKSPVLHSIQTKQEVHRSDFMYWSFEDQYSKLTAPQKEVVDDDSLKSPLRIDGAAGTGKTMSMILRAYRLLEFHRKKGLPFRTIFFAHSQSTFQRNLDAFQTYSNSYQYLTKTSPQSIEFTTLLDYCATFASIPLTSLLERDAGEAKTFQLMLLENVLSHPDIIAKIRTFRPLLSPELQDMFDPQKTSPIALYNMLQHEFSIQIKGRTDSTIDKYYDLSPIANGLPCSSQKDKELVFSIFCAYQNELNADGTFDIDDVVMEALSRLNAPIWRRMRAASGYDYIFVDEMHLFNLNEQSVFHFLTKDLYQKNIPICFALDYSQAIGDRGNVSNEYIEHAFGAPTAKKYHTVFRNSPQITDFCVSIATSGVLMFHEHFSDPYNETHSNFLLDNEKKSEVPSLYEYDNDDEMLNSLKQHLQSITKNLKCSPKNIAIIAFDDKFYSPDVIERISQSVEHAVVPLNGRASSPSNKIPSDSYIIASPYDINGMEFDAVILLGVDEGRVPQTAGTSDISQHFIKYSAYNLLYLTSSRAKYRLILLGNRLKGRSSCLDHSIISKYLIVK